MKLFIKNLVTKEDEQWLKEILAGLEMRYEDNIELGQLILAPMMEPGKLMRLKSKLSEKGFVIMYDRKSILTEQVKLLVKELFQADPPVQENYSVYISKRMSLNYTYLANIFSELTGSTIEHYIINQKIEAAKQMLLRSDYNIGQIADSLHYSSIGHFSNQFKKVTGLNPSEFKKKEKTLATS